MKRLLALLLSALVAFPAPAVPLRLALTALAAAPVLLVADAADARSSGGYSRPGGGFRTPSFRPPRPSYSAPSRPRIPSTSGGYGRSGGGSGGGLGGIFGGGSSSGGDRSMSREQSGGALGSYRSRERAPQGLPPSAAPSDGRSYGPPIRTPRQAPRDGYDRGYAPDSYARNRSIFGGGGGGLGNVAFMWLLLQSLSRPGYADYFHHRQDTPEYRQWRAEADKRAATDPELKATLDKLDAQLAAKKGTPVDPGYIPPDPPKGDVSRTPSTESGGFGNVLFLLVVLVIVGGALFMWMRSRKRSAAATARPSSPWGTATEILRGKISGEAYQPRTFRVGMTIPVDPTPFILTSATKVPMPQFGSDNLISVMAVGELDGPGQGDLTRLYMDETGFFQLHLDGSGQPDECRYFARIDEVHPADADEWAFWLDDKEGMIGWPEFQTKDGSTYPRAWSPGGTRIEPRVFTETLTDIGGSREVKKSMMLYRGPSGAAAPAPEYEYILVTAVEAGSQAWVEICAGIDVNPAALSLA